MAPHITINKRLNLVVPVERDDGSTLHIHAMPLATEVFQRYFLPISKTFARLYAEGIASIAGGRVAAMMLRQVAEEMGKTEDVEQGLLEEIKRLSNVLVLTPQGWKTEMLHNALARGLVTPDEWEEAEGAVVFFIVASAMHKRTTLPGILAGLAQLWGAQATPLNCTEYAASLRTSTKADDTTATPATTTERPSRIPS